MKTLRNALFASVGLAASLGLSAPALSAAPSDILFILDGSGSMWGQVDGVSKIQTAKSALGKLLDEVPADARLGLITYGNHDEKSCSDVTYANPLGADRRDIKAMVDQLKPLGKTPIDMALDMGLRKLAETEPNDIKKSMVLISDGIETCNGDPCDTAALAKYNGVDLKIHVVGFNVDAEARQQLQCIADQGGGQYFDAADTKGFEQAMASVAKVAQVQPEPEVAPTGVFFEDEFDGDGLSSAWTVQNEDPEGYVVEDGSLLMATSSVQEFGTGEPVNLVSFNQDLPKGDWDMTMNVNFDGQTGRDSIWFGLYADPQNYLGIQYYNSVGHCSETVLRLVKKANGDATKFDSRTSGSTTCGFGAGDTQAVITSQAEDGLVLTLSKRGRSYHATATLDGIVGDAGTARTVSTEKLTSLRLPGKPAFLLGKWENVDGEVLSFVDRIEIREVK
jgi:Mg-chelatase subunit ChlD